MTIDELREKMSNDAKRLRGMNKTNPEWIANLDENILLMKEHYKELNRKEKAAYMAMISIRYALKRKGL